MKKNICNAKDHQLWNRRSFLQALGLTGLSSMVLANNAIAYANTSRLNAALNAIENDKILLIIKLFGGNDGLNTIVPINQYSAYANSRPTLKVPQNQLIKLNDAYGMRDVMGSLEPMWKEGQFKIIHSVGYDNQSKSHFKGTDLWASAEIDTDIQDTGWLGRYFDNAYEDFLMNPPASPLAIEIGSTRNITFDGEQNKYSYSVANIESLKNIAETGKVYESGAQDGCEYGDMVSFLRSTYNNAFVHAGKIQNAYEQSSDYTGGVGGYPANSTAYGKLGESLNLISRLIKGNLGTKIYMVTLSGFDTHSAQTNTHKGLLDLLSKSVAYFHEDLKAAGWGDKVLTMAQSEFGRRVAENGSKGTDHGAAGPIMLFGEGLNGSGFVGQHSDLDDLYRGNLRHHTDFRQVYSTLLKSWLCIDPALVDSMVLGHEFQDLDLGLQCNTLSTNTPESGGQQNFTTHAFYSGDQTMITVQSDLAQHMGLVLYDLHGRRVALVEQGMLYPGTKTIDLNQKVPGLRSGMYIYRIQSNYGVISKKILVR